MPLELVRQDITLMKVDAIVNAANSSLLGGGGVDGAIHRRAGSGLLAECRALGGCRTGEAKITGGYGLDAKYVIHTVGPVYKDGKSGEGELLEECYRNSLRLAKEKGLESIAFPLISSGAYGYPKEPAMKIARDTIAQFLEENEMQVYLVVYDRPAYLLGLQLYSDISEFIDDNYVDTHTVPRRRWSEAASQPSASFMPTYSEREKQAKPAKPAKQTKEEVCCYSLRDSFVDEDEELFGWLKRMDESFSQMLLRLIDEKGMTDAQCYKKANIDRKLFSKIRSDVNYKPSKQTAIAFAISLELSLPQTEELLRKAGYALSHSNKFDIIIEYFITKGNYNVYEINEALFAFDQCLLGV